MNRTDSTSRRPAIGILTGSFHTDYSRRIAQAICMALEGEPIDVYLFQGLDASRFLNLTDYVDTGFDLHYYSQFEYSSFLSLDVLIVSYGTISAVKNALDLETFLSLLPDVPVILLETESALSNGIYVTVDNYTGMKACVDHLIECHDCKKMIYVSGPKGVADAEVRLSAYRDSLTAHGVSVDEELICYGDFTDSVDDLVWAMLEKFPDADAVVCANDEMAESAYRAVYNRGLTPGQEIAVTGFDDNPSASFMTPPLTSVLQNNDLVADAVSEAVRSYLAGEKPECVHLPAELVVRQSCGCSGQEDELVEEGHEMAAYMLMNYRIQNKHLVRDNMLSALMLRNLLSEHINIHTFFRNLGKMLHSLGTAHSWIALLREPLTLQPGQRMRVPDQLRLHMVQNGDQVESYSRIQAPVICSTSLDVVPRWDCPSEYPTAVFPLFYGNVHYGVLAVALHSEEMLFNYALSLEIGTGLRYLFMALDQQDAHQALEEKNRILDYSASHDGLTGLFNRVGVMNHIYAFVRACGRGHRFVAIMADLDHLKQINDTFGHAAGDTAIKAATELLRNTLPEGSPLGRTGGDEFTGLFLLQDEFDEDAFCSALRAACHEYNTLTPQPYYEEISVGCYAFDFEQATDIPALLKRADEKLYEAKAKRRDNVIRKQEEPSGL